MDNAFYFLFYLLLWLLINSLGLISLSKQLNTKNWNVKGISRYWLLSIIIEIIGGIFIIVSISFPWYFHHLSGWIEGFRYIYLFEATNLNQILIASIYLMYLLGIIIILAKTILKHRIRLQISIEIIEFIMIFLGIAFIISLHFNDCNHVIYLPEIYCINSGFSTGYFLYIFGITILITNSLQLSIYSRLKKKGMN
jgi:hypothetical protein